MTDLKNTSVADFLDEIKTGIAEQRKQAKHFEEEYRDILGQAVGEANHTQEILKSKAATKKIRYEQHASHHTRLRKKATVLLALKELQSEFSDGGELGETQRFSRIIQAVSDRATKDLPEPIMDSQGSSDAFIVKAVSVMLFSMMESEEPSGPPNLHIVENMLDSIDIDREWEDDGIPNLDEVENILGPVNGEQGNNRSDSDDPLSGP